MNSNRSDIDPFSWISGYYDHLVNQYGHSPRACDYGRPQSQETKFRILSEVTDLSGQTILDVGCGFADYAAYLSDHFPDVRYRGVDLSSRMIESAKALHPELDLRLVNILRDTLNERFDVVSANGIFYLLGSGAEAMMKDLIRTMFSLADHALAFNSLSGWTEDPEAGEFYADPVETLLFCRKLTPWVTIRHDYHPRDFTIYMYKSSIA